MGIFSDWIVRGTRAAQPAAAASNKGMLYYVTDESRLERSSASAWQAMAIGRVVQVVNTQTGAVATGSSGIPLDDTIPQNTEGDEYMTLSITPTSATNKLKIEVVAMLSANAAVWVIGALFQDSVANAIAASMELCNSVGGSGSISFTHYMAAGTTSATTFKFRAGRATYAGSVTTLNGSAAARFLGGVMASSITITEIAP